MKMVINLRYCLSASIISMANVLIRGFTLGPLVLFAELPSWTAQLLRLPQTKTSNKLALGFSSRQAQLLSFYNSRSNCLMVDHTCTEANNKEGASFLIGFLKQWKENKDKPFGPQQSSRICLQLHLCAHHSSIYLTTSCVLLHMVLVDSLVS
ncbi:uncharacterized protein LOC131174803 [Hevea brasiliensis]|uniref:uncharacterized protein LOC131174803 n=1 Tax=Hevea brasiliensis TaxID=3981 RepID=UPI0025F533AE|nr:uncharacterized protein LOC131174803 [Hevea brasiliensis]